MGNTDWAFNVQEHFEEHYAAQIGFIPDMPQRYSDRITGSVESERGVVIPKPVGPDNATRYKRWVTLPPIHWDNLTSRPRDWRYFVLMIGLLPDGQPWWSALYEERDLAALRDLSEHVSGAGKGFYRFDPGLTDRALIKRWDRDQPEFLDSPAVYTATLGGKAFETRDQAEFMTSIWDYARGYGARGEGPEDTVTGRIDVGDVRMSVHIE